MRFRQQGLNLPQENQTFGLVPLQVPFTLVEPVNHNVMAGHEFIVYTSITGSGTAYAAPSEITNYSFKLRTIFAQLQNPSTSYTARLQLYFTNLSNGEPPPYDTNFPAPFSYDNPVLLDVDVPPNQVFGTLYTPPDIYFQGNYALQSWWLGLAVTNHDANVTVNASAKLIVDQIVGTQPSI